MNQRSRIRYPVWPHTFVSPSMIQGRAVVSYWRKNVHEVLLVNRLGGLSLPRMDGWMDDLRFYVLLNSISGISGRCLDDNEGLCAMELRLRVRIELGPLAQ